ncbi:MULTISPECIES: hypothetical protein [Cyanophyceae]|uniref:hypothetical protein n=1 Tax=Cyanophyceae TaxID=3028117 RepID=UPI0016881A8E|nr:hypothetical protein [Trichocoleus sp. FACHB-40]MBD2003605.1 hypothetical protein [Trichocoleus sp. FACHB-40]
MLLTRAEICGAKMERRRSLSLSLSQISVVAIALSRPTQHNNDQTKPDYKFWAFLLQLLARCRCRFKTQPYKQPISDRYQCHLKFDFAVI